MKKNPQQRLRRKEAVTDNIYIVLSTMNISIGKRGTSMDNVQRVKSFYKRTDKTAVLL